MMAFVGFQGKVFCVFVFFFFPFIYLFMPYCDKNGNFQNKRNHLQPPAPSQISDVPTPLPGLSYGKVFKDRVGERVSEYGISLWILF